jgi:hypothetical protein
MSITPREPPSAINSDAAEPRGSQSSSTRLAYRCLRAICAAPLWMWRGLRGLADRIESTVSGVAPDGEVENRRRRPGARVGIGGRKGGFDEPSDRGELPGECGSSGRKLPPRPDLDAERTEGGLMLRRPGRKEAYVTSDEWQEVRR